MTITATPGAGIGLSQLSRSYGAVRAVSRVGLAIAKTGTRNRAEAVRTADDNGWL